MGIVSAPNALFFVAVGFILVLLLHFSAAMSRLSDQSKVLAQRHAILEQQRPRARAGAESAGQTTSGSSRRCCSPRRAAQR